MRKIRKLTVPGYIALLYFLCSFSMAQTNNFELKNNDRVVFLGNSIFENETYFGYLELALTTRWPDRNVTFRNIGWTGDNVFGEARSYFTNPPTSYDLLMEQITNAKPTVVFIAYGGIESQNGEAGKARFKDGLNKLIDKINALGAETILLSPIPLLTKIDSDNLKKQNAQLVQYSAEIAKVASERGKRFVDILNPMKEINERIAVSENGIHLNETGYYFLANILEKGLGLPSRQEEVAISIKNNVAEGPVPVKVAVTGKNFDALSFSLRNKILPLSVPAGLTTPVENRQAFKITGLKKGIYSLKAGNDIIAVANAEDWAKGVEINEGLSFQKTQQLRHMILKKSDIFFQQYRPLNRTYIVGFRKYEQGRHQEGLDNMNILITWLETQINSQRTPETQDYQLIQVK